ncbi:hypothetical protein GCM10028803_40750 [Larkinella knui]|uniref:N-acetyltransferase n=1 Tax=Larkinella knui TaxID=2025310 RepID=A0A3P1CND1_9BACT|nr:GNAT family N-acetyltransferase [Larkinella knui]RRB14710.1 N-acetyltransferase [Larkinella knui]
MTSLFSKRLQLIPLPLTDLDQLAISRTTLETARGLEISDLKLSGDYDFMAEFQDALPQYIIPGVIAHPDDWFWYTHWLIVHRELNLTIGGIGVAGTPDADGQTLIGYFMDQRFEGRQFTTEAVACFLEWIFEHPDVKTVVADTPAHHIASQRVLQKNGFLLVGDVEEGVRWKRTRFPSDQV